MIIDTEQYNTGAGLPRFGRLPRPVDLDPEEAGDIRLYVPDLFGAEDISGILGEDFSYFAMTAAGYVVHSLLQAGKKEAIAGAVRDFMKSVNQITPADAYRAYYEYIKQYTQ
ncbi:MAG: hypothetical protein IKQ25_09380 [Lachnospiraceae bacterium]|nr:hypothetical protein [Lachnospiraceae bacterium]